MSEKIKPTGSSEGMLLRTEPEKEKKVEEVEKTSPHVGIEKEPETDIFESTQKEQKEKEDQEKKEEQSPIEDEKENEDSQEGIDTYA